MPSPRVADESLYVTLTDIQANRSYVYQAVSDVTSQDGSEITAEPGVAGRIGPDLPARMTIKVSCVTLDSGAARLPVVSGGHIEMLKRDAINQYQQLRLLKRRPIRIAARAVPDVQTIWAIENVHVSDSLQDTNHFDVSVNLIELIGGVDSVTGGGAKLALGTITLPPPPPVTTTTDANGDGVPDADPNTPTGAGDKKCVPTFSDEVISAIGGGTTFVVDHLIHNPVSDAVGSFFGWLGSEAEEHVIAPTVKVAQFVGEVAVESADIAVKTAQTLWPRCTFGG